MSSKLSDKPLYERAAEIKFRFSEFEIPPMQDALLIGRKAPIGPEAVRRMVNAIAPDTYEVVKVEHSVFEAVVIRKNLLRFLPREKVVAIILEEGEKFAGEHMVIRAQVDVTVYVTRTVDLG